MTSLNDDICPTLGMVCKNIFLQNIPLIIFNYDQFVANGKFKGLKHQLSSQITEK